jgi:hypothetical protein
MKYLKLMKPSPALSGTLSLRAREYGHVRLVESWCTAREIPPFAGMTVWGEGFHEPTMMNHLLRTF